MFQKHDKQNRFPYDHFDKEELLKQVLSQYQLDINGIHGQSHWERVYENAKILSKHFEVSPIVIELFSFLHDSCRLNDSHDPAHGKRAAEFAYSLQGSIFKISDVELDWLCEACLHHSFGKTEAHITVKVCWDADRLDLGRAGIKPNPKYLCTTIAKQESIIEKAYAKGLDWRNQRKKNL